jgi:DNA processing protein
MGRQDTVNLLALCRLKGLSWYLLAREALRSRDLSALLDGSVTEQSDEATEARLIITAARPHLAKLKDDAAAIIRDAEARGARLTTVVDDDYPLNLRTIYNLPPFLFYRGRLESDQDARSVAVVGTRAASSEGIVQARQVAVLLAGHGVTVLSGLARGIDTAAHDATLEAGGRTVAVMGTGINTVYPAENRKLAESIVDAGGALVSQFWPDASPMTYSFPRRNVTMSGMGQGTVVIEASSTSGAKMQARLALDHGKKVFLVHDLVTRQPWTRKAVARGAVEIFSVADIITRLRAPEIIRERTRKADQLELLAEA